MVICFDEGPLLIVAARLGCFELDRASRFGCGGSEVEARRVGLRGWVQRYNRFEWTFLTNWCASAGCGQKCALCTIVQVNGSIPSYESAKMLVREDGSMIGTIGGGCVEAEVWTAAREVIESEKPSTLNFSLGRRRLTTPA